MHLHKLALLALVVGAACGGALANVTTSTSGLTTTYFENFEDASSFSGGIRVPDGADDYLLLNLVAPNASFSFYSAVALTTAVLDFYYALPTLSFVSTGTGQVSLDGGPISLTPTGNYGQVLGTNPGDSSLFDDHFALNFSNLSSGWHTVTFSRSAGALGPLKLDEVSLTVTAVPEPQTYALMLGGLGLVGWVARRRRPNRD